MQGQASFYDGITARRHVAQLSLSNDRLSLMITSETLRQRLYWRLTELRELTGEVGDKNHLVLTRHVALQDEANRDETTSDVARLVIEDPQVIAVIRKTRPNLQRADLHKGTGLRLLKATGVAVCAIGLMLFVILPAMANTLARIIPLEREIAFGKSVTAQMERFLGAKKLGGLQCDQPDGLQALQVLSERLTQGQNLEYDIQLTVFDHAMLNAFAAPGGQVVVLRGLLDNAGSADEVAGVLAHEIGHVVNRDATRHALRATGSAGLLSMVLGDFTGGALVVAVGEQLISAAYTRDAEAKADDFAIEMLTSANVSSAGMGDFFDTIQKMTGGPMLPNYLNTHPETLARAELARANAATQQDTSPVLTDAQWADLKNICADH